MGFMNVKTFSPIVGGEATMMWQNKSANDLVLP